MLIVAGGYTYGSKGISSTEIMTYYPWGSTMSWTETYSLPVAIRGGPMVNLNNQVFLFGGGLGEYSCSDCYSDKVYEYQPATYRWVENERRMEYARSGHAVSVVKMKNICPE